MSAGGHTGRARLALARLPEADPAIAALALWCVHRDGEGLTETRGETIRYGAEFPLLPISEQVGVLAHHVLHVAFRHSARRASLGQRLGANFEADLYDLACDALVNEALLQGGHALPRPAVRASDLVARLPAEERPRNVLAEWDSDRLYFALAAAPGAAGKARRRDARDYAKVQQFEPDLGHAAAESAEAEIWTARIEQGLAAGRSAGAGIGTVLARFGDLPRAEVPWEVRLRRLVHKALSQSPRLSHRRPARAWLARDAWARQAGGPQPVFEPGWARTDRRPRLVVGLDTSSSVTEEELNLFAAEAISLTRRAGAEAHLLGFDTEVHHRSRLERSQSLAGLEMRRDGGTDFAAVFAEAQGLNPSLIVIFTDLDADLAAQPGAPVIWAVPDPPRQPPRYGEVVLLRAGPDPT
ncbi:MAG: VWA-like domain-containing protein [Pseudomonadota bacterium]